MSRFYDTIDELRERPALFMGKKSLTVLRNFIDGGYAFFKFNLDDEKKELYPLPFSFFNYFVANYYNYNESTSGWKNIILCENNNDEELSYDIFYMLFDKFRSIKINNRYECVLTLEHTDFHTNNKNAPKRLLPPDYTQNEPLYINPKVIYLLELSENSGYLCMIKLVDKTILEINIFKNKITALEHFKEIFGELLVWNPVGDIPENFECF